MTGRHLRDGISCHRMVLGVPLGRRCLSAAELDRMADVPLESLPDEAIAALSAIRERAEGVVAAGLESALDPGALSAYEYQCLAAAQRAADITRAQELAGLVAIATGHRSDGFKLLGVAGDSDAARIAYQCDLLTRSREALIGARGQ